MERRAEEVEERSMKVYKWKEGPRKSVGIELSVQLPQFSVRGYRAKNKLEVLSTGKIINNLCSTQV